MSSNDTLRNFIRPLSWDKSCLPFSPTKGSGKLPASGGFGEDV